MCAIHRLFFSREATAHLIGYPHSDSFATKTEETKQLICDYHKILIRFYYLHSRRARVNIQEKSARNAAQKIARPVHKREWTKKGEHGKKMSSFCHSLTSGQRLGSSVTMRGSAVTLGPYAGTFAACSTIYRFSMTVPFQPLIVQASSILWLAHYFGAGSIGCFSHALVQTSVLLLLCPLAVQQGVLTQDWLHLVNGMGGMPVSVHFDDHVLHLSTLSKPSPAHIDEYQSH